MDLLRPLKHQEKYARPMEEIVGDLQTIENRAFYTDLIYYLESERAQAIMTLKSSDSDEARAKWKFIDKLLLRYENLRKEVKYNRKQS